MGLSHVKIYGPQPIMTHGYDKVGPMRGHKFNGRCLIKTAHFGVANATQRPSIQGSYEKSKKENLYKVVDLLVL